MGWPQIAVVLLMALNILAGLVLDGTPRKPWSFSQTTTDVIVLAFLLYAGGFWK